MNQFSTSRSKSFFSTLAAAALTIFVAACATAGPKADAKKVEENLKEAVAKETPTSNPGELAARGFEAWSQSVNLNGDQKSKLYTIHSTTGREAFRIRDEITKTKSAMFKELAKGEYDKKLVAGFKTKIVKLDQERLDIMFNALASVEKTLGRGSEAIEYFKYLDRIESQGFREY